MMGSCSQQGGFQCGVPLPNDDWLIATLEESGAVHVRHVVLRVKDVGQFAPAYLAFC